MARHLSIVHYMTTCITSHDVNDIIYYQYTCNKHMTFQHILLLSSAISKPSKAKCCHKIGLRRNTSISNTIRWLRRSTNTGDTLIGVALLTDRCQSTHSHESQSSLLHSTWQTRDSAHNITAWQTRAVYKYPALWQTNAVYPVCSQVVAQKCN